MAFFNVKICLLAMVALIEVDASDLVRYDLNTQAKCTEVTRRRTSDCIWPAGLYPFPDWVRLNGKIVAYKIQWFNGRWSGWYVPGLNDIDHKFNPSGRQCSPLAYRSNTMRRTWSYFFDHNHKYIICKT